MEGSWGNINGAGVLPIKRLESRWTTGICWNLDIVWTLPGSMSLGFRSVSIYLLLLYWDFKLKWNSENGKMIKKNLKFCHISIFRISFKCKISI